MGIMTRGRFLSPLTLSKNKYNCLLYRVHIKKNINLDLDLRFLVLSRMFLEKQMSLRSIYFKKYINCAVKINAEVDFL